MLKAKNVNYKDLCLDPKNPRLAHNFSVEQIGSNGGVEGAQEELEALFVQGGDFTNITDLKNSMRQIGFVGIQNIIVRELPKKKYLVIEGNRRVAAIKALIKEDRDALPNTPAKIDDEEKLKSLKTIQVMVLQTKDLTEAEIQKQIKITLGLRHIGGQLEWEPLPKGKNIYLEYMKQLPDESSFEWNAKIGSRIADILAIDKKQVKSSLRGYLAYTQMGKINSSVLPHHYSLILACVTNGPFATYGFISLDKVTYELEGDSANSIAQICEFEERDKRDGIENILRDPKAVNRLGLILKDSKTHPSQPVKDTASGLFQEVLLKEQSLEQAYTDLTAFKKTNQWVQSIEKLIKKQQEEPNLASEEFKNVGKELELKDKLKNLVERFKVLMEV